jgi:2-C-methyl-D-erythritol 2,4-cyclodiphosphate synthase
VRIGNGYDLHRLVEGRPLILGGVIVPHDRGLLGHSDGDALTHAIINALLGTCALGDIGTHFPPSDSKYKDANSMDLLKHSYELLQAKGYSIVNLDAMIICERPKLSPYFQAMRESLSKLLAVDLECVSVKAATNEGIGEIGQGLAIAVHAVALVE